MWTISYVLLCRFHNSLNWTQFHSFMSRYLFFPTPSFDEAAYPVTYIFGIVVKFSGFAWFYICSSYCFRCLFFCHRIGVHVLVVLPCHLKSQLGWLKPCSVCLELLLYLRLFVLPCGFIGFSLLYLWSQSWENWSSWILS